MWNYDQKEIQKKFSMVRSQDGWVITNMEKKNSILLENKFSRSIYIENNCTIKI